MTDLLDLAVGHSVLPIWMQRRHYRFIRLASCSAAARSAPHQKADRLTDCLDAFDAFILDGFGVINLGMENEGIEEFFRRAELAGKPVVILTNAASALLLSLRKNIWRWGCQ